MDQRERRRARYVGASIEKQLAALPVIADYCRRLDLADIIDRACPVRDLAHLPHGQVIEALVANRLTSPAPLVRVTDWARELGTLPTCPIHQRCGRGRSALVGRPGRDQSAGPVTSEDLVDLGGYGSIWHLDADKQRHHDAMVNAGAGLSLHQAQLLNLQLLLAEVRETVRFIDRCEAAGVQWSTSRG